MKKWQLNFTHHKTHYIQSTGSIGLVILVKCLFVKRTGLEMHDKIVIILGQHLALRVIKQLNKQITTVGTVVLNISR